MEKEKKKLNLKIIIPVAVVIVVIAIIGITIYSQKIKNTELSEKLSIEEETKSEKLSIEEETKVEEKLIGQWGYFVAYSSNLDPEEVDYLYLFEFREDGKVSELLYDTSYNIKPIFIDSGTYEIYKDNIIVKIDSDEIELRKFKYNITDENLQLKQIYVEYYKEEDYNEKNYKEFVSSNEQSKVIYDCFKDDWFNIIDDIRENSINIIRDKYSSYIV